MNFTYSDELYHYGIRGMKWGKHKKKTDYATDTEETEEPKLEKQNPNVTIQDKQVLFPKKSKAIKKVVVRGTDQHAFNVKGGKRLSSASNKVIGSDLGNQVRSAGKKLRTDAAKEAARNVDRPGKVLKRKKVKRGS